MAPGHIVLYLEYCSMDPMEDAWCLRLSCIQSTNQDILDGMTHGG